jgi:hypothetical protein
MRHKTTYGYTEPSNSPNERHVEVGDGHFTSIDECYYAMLSVYTWSLNDTGEPRTQIPHANGGNAVVLMKNMILGTNLKKGFCVKYLDGNYLNNHCSNLKIMTLKEARNLDNKLFGKQIRRKKVVTKDIRKILLLK